MSLHPFNRAVTFLDKQTGTLRSESPTPSEEGRHDPEVGLDRQRIDRDEARRRFDRAVVDARDVDFSDRIGADRKSYKISSRRRRHRQRNISDTDGSSNSEDESLPSRLARLRRETEELRIELEQRDNEDNAAADSAGLEDDFAKLNTTLEGLQIPQRQSRDGQPAPETQTLDSQQPETRTLPPETTPATITAIATFSDRLTSLESALGVSTTLPSTSNTSILPALTQLSTQIDMLFSTLTTSRNQSSALPTLDELSARVRAFVSETDKLTLSRKAALQSLSDLQEARLRNTDSLPYGHSRHLSTQSQAVAEQTATQQKTESKLFLDEQSSKISALYELLPTIQSLHPLLPTVLDRLRSLQVVHAGAAEARTDLEEIESRQKRMEEELQKWREGLDAVEAGMKEHEQTSRNNVEVVQQMVEGLEGRLKEASR